MKTNLRYTEHLKPYAQKLRREMTREEKRLWYDFLKDAPCTVKRQQIIGPYIVDFYAASRHLVIEIDGSQHGDEEQLEAYLARDRWLTNEGYRVLRYTNQQIHKNFLSVCEDILGYLTEDEG